MGSNQNKQSVKPVYFRKWDIILETRFGLEFTKEI